MKIVIRIFDPTLTTAARDVSFKESGSFEKSASNAKIVAEKYDDMRSAVEDQSASSTHFVMVKMKFWTPKFGLE